MWPKAISSETIEKICARHHCAWRDGGLDPRTTIHVYTNVLKVLRSDTLSDTPKHVAQRCQDASVSSTEVTKLIRATRFGLTRRR
jgi:hypothetical protein